MSIFRRTGLRLLLLALHLPAIFAAGARAEILHPLEDVVAAASAEATAAARAQGYTDLEVSARPLDSRLRLQACGEPLETFSNANASVLGPVSVGVRCAQPSAWTSASAPPSPCWLITCPAAASSANVTSPWWNAPLPVPPMR